MASNTKIILTAILAMVAGLAIGYMLFHDNSHEHTPSNEASMDNHVPEEKTWTCSMHPQIRQNEPGDCPICGMDLIPLEENTSNDPLVLKMTKEAIKLANIQTTIVGSKEPASDNSLPLSGKVQTDERLASSQVAHIPGRIEKLFVSFTGEQVREGQKIASLYSPELITAQKELLEALKLQSFNPQLVEAARNKLKYWKIAEATIESIEQSGIIQETFNVLADASGIVTNRRVSVGDYIQRGAPLFDLMSLQKVWVVFDAYEEDLHAISVGQQIHFTTPSITNKTFKTKVTFIDPLIDPQTRVASIRTELNNPNGLLKPEMFVYGRLQRKPQESVQLLIPKSAVLWTGPRSVVYVKLQEQEIPSFEFREVELGESIGDSYQIIQGLVEGEEIVTHGSFTIDAAAQLNNQASMMNRNVKVKNENTLEKLPDFIQKTPIAFKKQLAELADTYLQLKDALVLTDPKLTATKANLFTDKLSRINGIILKGESHQHWMTQAKSLLAHSRKISSQTDVEKQRKQFYFLSQVLIKSIKAFGISQNTLYIQHCPMANNDKGADWISREEIIRNPYFGDKMLACGLIKETITQDSKNTTNE